MVAGPLSYIGIPLLAFLAARLLTPTAIFAAVRLGAIDNPGGRKLHEKSTPRFGGVAVVAATALALAPGLLLTDILPLVAKNVHLLAALVWGGGIVFALGVYDDLRETNARWKFSVQALAALVTVMLGFRFDIVGIPFFGTVELGWLGIPLSMFWILGVVNAVNLIDGLDGLAAGLSLIMCVSVGAIALFRGDVLSVILCLALAGALAGFLLYNWNPARIFLGDSGSMWIGYVLALLALRSSSKGPTAVAVVAPILALGVPVIDTLCVMWLRFRAEPELGHVGRVLRMFRADRNHIHHLVLDGTGGRTRTAVVFLYVLGLLFAGSAVFTALSNAPRAGFVLLAIGLATVLAVRIGASRFAKATVSVAPEAESAPTVARMPARPAVPACEASE